MYLLLHNCIRIHTETHVQVELRVGKIEIETENAMRRKISDAVSTRQRKKWIKLKFF